MTVLSMDGSNPNTWDPALDGVHAAPENHAILYEDDEIRLEFQRWLAFPA